MVRRIRRTQVSCHTRSTTDSEIGQVAHGSTAHPARPCAHARATSRVSIPRHHCQAKRRAGSVRTSAAVNTGGEAGARFGHEFRNHSGSFPLQPACRRALSHTCPAITADGGDLVRLGRSMKAVLTLPLDIKASRAPSVSHAWPAVPSWRPHYCPTACPAAARSSFQRRGNVPVATSLPPSAGAGRRALKQVALSALVHWPISLRVFFERPSFSSGEASCSAL